MRVKRLSVAVVSTLFFIGILAGCVYCAGLDEAEILHISDAVKGYSIADGYGFWQVLIALLLSLAAPIAILAGTFFGLGIVIIPAAMLMGGFALSATLSSIILSMGTHAAASAFFVCGLPNLILLPCLFFLASEMFCVALNRAEPSLTRKGSRETVLLRRRLALCAVGILGGALVRAFLTPFFLSHII